MIKNENELGWSNQTLKGFSKNVHPVLTKFIFHLTVQHWSLLLVFTFEKKTIVNRENN